MATSGGLSKGQKRRIRLARTSIATEALQGPGTLRQRVAAAARTLPPDQAANLLTEAAKYEAPNDPRVAAVKSETQRAKAAMKQAGVTMNKLVQTTGTTRGEVRDLFNTTARKLVRGGVSPADTRSLVKALSGGPAAGVAHTPNQVATARDAAVQIRKAVVNTVSQPKQKKPRTGGGGRELA